MIIQRTNIERIRVLRNAIVIVTLAMAVTTSGVASADNSKVKSVIRRIVIPAGTVIPVTLDSPLSSRENQRGDKFTGTVRFGNDDAGLPEGTRVEGIVQEAIQSGDGKPGVLDVEFRRMVMPGGDTRTITASLYSLDGKAVKRSDGRLMATSNTEKDRLKWVGIGAGGGLLIGALTKQNSLLSGLLGAGAGYLANELSNKKVGDVELKQGSMFGVRFDRDMAFTAEDRGRNQRRNQDDNRQSVDSDDRTSFGHRTYLRGDSSDIGMLVNNREVRFDSSTMPYMRNGTVMVPLSIASRAAYFDCRYDSRSRMIYARNDTLRLALGSRMVKVGNDRHIIPVAAEMHNEAIFVPLQVIGWASDSKARWDDNKRIILINTERTK